MKTLTAKEFSQATGRFYLTPCCRDILRSFDCRYEELSPSETEKIVDQVRVETLNASFVGAPDREHRWESCWAETLNGYQQTQSDDNYQRMAWIDGEQKSELKLLGESAELSLIPKYLLDHQQKVLRLNERFIKPVDISFHLNFWRALRAQLFEEWLIWPNYLRTTQSAIYELGSGSAWNLAAIKAMFPTTKCYGLDWSPSAVTLASLIGDGGWRFNLRRPTPVHTPDRFAVITCGALEQIGGDHQPLLEWLLQQKPTLCLHVEPLLPLYINSGTVTPFDQLAMDYHMARGYLHGFLESLRWLNEQQKIEILKVQRVRFGGMYNEGYSYVVWRPR